MTALHAVELWIIWSECARLHRVRRDIRTLATLRESEAEPNLPYAAP